MAILKYSCNTYGDETKNGKDVITRVLEYILDCNKTRPELTGCVGVVRTCIPYMSNQFRAIQKLYKRKPDEMIVHLIVSFPELFDICEGMVIKEIADKTANTIGKEFQVVYAVHTDKIEKHIHFVINSVNFLNGKEYSKTVSNLKQYYIDIFNVAYIKHGMHPGPFMYSL